jgi:hypothetical protein
MEPVAFTVAVIRPFSTVASRNISKDGSWAANWRCRTKKKPAANKIKTTTTITIVRRILLPLFFYQILFFKQARRYYKTTKFV